MKVTMSLAPALIAVLVGGITTPVVTPQRNVPSARSQQVSTDATLEEGHFTTAMRAADTAHRRATRDGRWEPLIEVGDAYQRIAARAGAPEAAGKRARDAYGAALRSARHAESVDGVLRAAEAFAQVGDATEVESSLRVARELAGSDSEAIADVKAATARLSDLLETSRGAQ